MERYQVSTPTSITWPTEFRPVDPKTFTRHTTRPQSVTYCLRAKGRLNHKYGISPETFQGNNELCSFFKILTTIVYQNNHVYVSTAQSESYPVTAVQWHPELKDTSGAKGVRRVEFKAIWS